jgi:rhodanese-related sulfurtransferase
MPSHVTEVSPAPSAEARRHFESKLAFETDCWDVHASMSKGSADFVLLDVRGPDAYAKAHVPGAVSLPHGKIVASALDTWPEGAVFVVYCAGPHCNGADKAALRISRLGRPVKVMIGGMTGWADEGFAFAEASGPDVQRVAR